MTTVLGMSFSLSEDVDIETAKGRGERVLHRSRTKIEGGLFGVSENHIVGPTNTSNGYIRTRYAIAHQGGNGTFSARWFQAAPDTDPRVLVHVGVPVFGWIEYEVVIMEAPAGGDAG